MIQAAKTAVHLAASVGGALGLLGLLERLGRGRPGGVHVLMYHRIANPDDAPSLYPGLISATPAEFEGQMVALREKHRVISSPELLEALAHGRALPPRAVLLTFDDAYRDFLDHAWPILKRLDLPATMFVATGFPDAQNVEFWWDRLHRAICSADAPGDLLSIGGMRPRPRISTREAYRRLRRRLRALPHDQALELVEAVCAEVDVPVGRSSVLGWGELRALASQGLTLGAHTRTHPLLHRIPRDEMRAEIEAARQDLRRELGDTPPVFAYPGGACPDEAVEILRREGFAAAFTTRRGVADLRSHHPLLFPRIPVTQSITYPILRVQLLEQFAHVNWLWRR
jgi:peptidoglycan/xylan/chitin deacetylase (PgdA/CDA1 family)